VPDVFAGVSPTPAKATTNQMVKLAGSINRATYTAVCCHRSQLPPETRKKVDLKQMKKTNLYIIQYTMFFCSVATCWITVTCVSVKNFD